MARGIDTTIKVHSKVKSLGPLWVIGDLNVSVYHGNELALRNQEKVLHNLKKTNHHRYQIELNKYKHEKKNAEQCLNIGNTSDEAIFNRH